MTAVTRRAETAGSDPPIGLSSHNPEEALAAVKSGAIEVLMFSVNPCYALTRPAVATVLAGAGIGALEAFIRELGLPAYIDGFTDTLYNEY